MVGGGCVSGLEHVLDKLGGAEIATALEEVPVHAFVYDRDGVIRWQNRAAVADAGERIGEPGLALLTELSAERGLRLWEQAISGKPVEVTLEVRLSDGTTAWRDLSVAPLRDGGSVVGIFGVGVPAREQAPPSTASPSFGLTGRQLEILQLLAEGKSTAQIAEELFLSKVTVRNHIAHLMANLGVHSRMQAVAVANQAGLLGRQDLGMGGSLRALGEAFELLSEGVLIIDRAGRVVSVNPAACALLGRTERELRTPNYLLELDVRDETGVGIPGQWSIGTDVLETGQAVRELKVSVAKRDGSRMWLWINYQPLISATGRPVHGLVVSLRPSAEGVVMPRTLATADTPLTPRQLEILQLLADGHSTDEIAEALVLSKATVRNHIATLLTALGAHSRIQAIAIANRAS